MLPSDVGSPNPPRRRRHPVHGVLITSASPTIVFLTTCTKNRIPWLATSEVHTLLRRAWLNATARLVGRYVIMPDHIHLFAALGPREIDFDNWVRYWKSIVSKAHGNKDHRWQTDHWDRRMRTAQDCAAKWEYVWQNPVRHGLVSRAEDWPYQGELNRFEW